jgi:hypothetical protein
LLVGFQGDAAARADVAGRDAGEQLAATGFVQFAVVQSCPPDVDFGLADHAAQAEYQAVVVVRRVVDAVRVGDENREHGAEIEQLVPVLVRARPPADLASEDDADPTQRDLGEQALEPGVVVDGLAADALILSDDQDAGIGPIDADGAVAELIPYEWAYRIGYVSQLSGVYFGITSYVVQPIFK